MRSARLGLFAAVLVLPLARCATAAAPTLRLEGARIVVCAAPDPLETLAAREIQRYLGLMGAGRRPIAGQPASGGVNILVGTPTTLPAVAATVADAESSGPLGDEGFVLRVQPGPTVVVAGRTPRAVLWAAYALLERMGVGFYLGGDALAAATPEVPADLDTVERPAFAVRGSLPWYNFLDSPTTWDRDDFRYFFDQMAKMRNNFVGFHSYDSEPFCAYEFGGKVVGGEPLVTAHNYGWGAVEGMASADFGFGTGDFFFDREFGSRPALQPGTREQAIARQKALLADGLAYARARGIRVCVGFEVSGDPTTPENQQRLEARLIALLKAYPMLDYVWIWQSEGLGGGSDLAAPGSPLALATERWSAPFAYLKEPARIHEAIRVMLYSRMAHALLKRIAPKVRMIVSGWGGDRWMRFSDFYIGLDTTLPPDVIFAALDNIDPSIAPTVAEAYGRLSPSRERWPIPWWESDGGYSRRDQWGPQCNARPFEPLCRDALAKGAQGMLAIHWRTRDVEEAAAFQAQFAWNPDLTSGSFFDEMARRSYGPRWASAMSAVHQELEALGPRYTGAYGQIECGGFEWFSDGRLPIAANLERLATIRRRVAAVRAEMVADGKPAGLERLDWLAATIDWLTRYDAAAMTLRPGGAVDRLLARAEEVRTAGDIDGSSTLAAEAAAAFRASGLGAAMRTYPAKMTTCGEWGALATINVKAYAAWKRIAARIRSLGADPGAEDREPFRSQAVSVVMRTPPSIVEPGAPIEVAAIITGGPSAARVRYRAPGAAKWSEAPLAAGYRSSWTGVIPARAVTAAGIEYAVEARDSDGRWLSGASDRAPALRSASALRLPRQRQFALPAERGPGGVRSVSAVMAADYEVRLTWQTTRPGAECLVVRTPGLAGAFPVRTRLSEMSDVGTSAGSTYMYAITPLDSQGRPGRSVSARVIVPRLPAPPAPRELAARPGAGVIRLSWSPLPGRLQGYRVYRAPADGGAEVSLNPTQSISQPLFRDTTAGTARWSYRVSAIDRGGQEGARSKPAVASAMERPTGPAFRVALSSDAAGGALQSPAAITGGALDTRRGGWLQVPHQPSFELDGEFAVALWFRAASVSSIPVLASCGEFQKQGWFVQILGGAVRFSLGGDNILDAGRIEPDTWRHVVCTSDGAVMRVYLDGAPVGERPARVVDYRPWPGPLFIGQYHFLQDIYQFHGQIADLRLYTFAPTPAEIAAIHAAGRPGAQ